jgi:hypothetical protein
MINITPKEKPGEPICQGQIFRANVSQYSTDYARGKDAGRISIGFAVRLRRMKTYSCHGCEKCAWIFEYISEIDDEDFPVEDIEKAENGKLYLLEGVFSPGDYYEGGYQEFENFRIVEWPHEYRTDGRLAFERGKKPEDCPYPNESDKRRAEWIEGYIQADAQEAGETG